MRWHWAYRWPPGIVLTTLRYFLCPPPIHRVDEHEAVLAPELPDACGRGIQTIEQGTGRSFHRRYGVFITASRLEPEQIMGRLMADPNAAVPPEIALFETEDGHDTMRVGDELVVRMPGPWEGPVRVIHTSSTSFRLATLAGHFEAGQIEFRTVGDGEQLRFEIESWARCSDEVVNLLYDRLTLLREMQTYLWARYCEQVCALCGGDPPRSVDVYTGCESQP
ncbi:uncharacterized protein DUF1990 [Halopolyspora algeriensis]|uniref:Uncharacterized protein DUF1990 n=2 Tax=Halopolyspora algeriensis TaxID=1500506 RepID=A0A368VHW4_9ACTN|nr:uncharacterized protein DUF1990 [Halopolyspora algeriensis]TQM53928.1 uncharacterized protein DUF1990 [Halopolyspora algeriensis]